MAMTITTQIFTANALANVMSDIDAYLTEGSIESANTIVYLDIKQNLANKSEWIGLLIANI